jgi:hypothetical protein
MQITFTLSDENAVFVRNFLVTHDIHKSLFRLFCSGLR